MQLSVVAAILPSLVLLSRTRTYSIFRIGGALFATVASVAWLAERLLNVQTVIASLVESTAQHGPLIAVALFLASVFCWLMQVSPMTETQDMDRISPEMR
jgi:anaerobic C4-dicarboxylate transporter